MRRVRMAAHVLLVVGLAGCGSSTMPSPLPMVEGHWQGSITSPADGVGTITVDLKQSGAVVTGSVLLAQPGLPDQPGTFSATIESVTGKTTLRYTTFYDYLDGCTGTYGGSLDVSAGVLSGTYVGQNCAHTFTGDMRVEKR